MWSHTHSLEWLVIGATIAPAELVRVATSFRPGAGVAAAGPSAGAERARAARLQILGVPSAYATACLLAVAVAAAGGFTSQYLTDWSVSWPWAPAAAAVGCAVVALELGVGAAPQVLRGVRRIRFGVDAGPGTVGSALLASIVATAVVEEVLYRGVWIGTLNARLHVPAAIAVAASAVAYALGHLFFGSTVVMQKAVTGAVLGTLLVASGSLIVPLVAHITQNVTVFGFASRRRRRG
jgi:membrane protease YdiL (CAAX protease family)